MKKGTRMYWTLEAIVKHGPLWSYEVNKVAGYFKACTRASDLAKMGYVEVVEKSEKRPYMYRYKATDKGIREVGLHFMNNVVI